MTPQDKRQRAAKLREIAKERDRSVANEVIALAKQLEKAADDQEREEAKLGKDG